MDVRADANRGRAHPARPAARHQGQGCQAQVSREDALAERGQRGCAGRGEAAPAVRARRVRVPAPRRAGRAEPHAQRVVDQAAAAQRAPLAVAAGDGAAGLKKFWGYRCNS